jgi:hypothetical protein
MNQSTEVSRLGFNNLVRTKILHRKFLAASIACATFTLFTFFPYKALALQKQLIYFDRPQGWEMRQIDKETYTAIVLMSPDKKYHIQFILKEIPKDLQSKTAEQLNDIDEIVSRRKAIKHSSGTMKVADTIGVCAWLTYQDQKSGLHMVHYTIQLKHKSTFLTINCIAGEKEKNAAVFYFEKYKPETSAVVNSIKFIDNINKLK